MSNFFKKKSEKDKAGSADESARPEEGAGTAAPSPPVTPEASQPAMPAKESKRRREKKAKAPREKKPKKPRPVKGPRKPLFSFGKKKATVETPAEGVTATAAPETPAGPQTPAAPSVPVSPTVTTGQAESGEAKPKKKGLFGGKAGREPRAGKEKKPKVPREKKEKKPRQPREKKEKKPRAPRAKREKKVREPRGKREKRVREPREKKPKAAKAKGGFGGSKMSPVGLDLGRNSITAARLRYQTGGSVLLQAGIDVLPEGLIQEGEVRDVEGLSLALKEFWKAHKIKGRKVALGLANQKVVVRTLEFPRLDEKELRSAIEFQAQEYIPIPVEQAVFDFHVLGTFTDSDGVEKQKVLVVAAQKDMVMDFINAVKGARLGVTGVDLQAFALLRALAPKSFIEQEPASLATAIVNVSADVTNLVVDVGGEPQFTRVISFGGDNFTRAVQDMQGVTFAEADEIKVRVGLGAPVARGAEEPAAEQPPEAAEAETGIIRPTSSEHAPDFIPPAEQGPAPGESGPGGMPPIFSTEAEPGRVPDFLPRPISSYGEAETELEQTANIQKALEVTADALADEIRRSLDYYMSQEQSVPVGRLIISGGGAMLINLEAYLSQLFPFNVETGNPISLVSQNKSDLTDEELQALAPRLTIAIGLALEDEG